MNLNVEELAGVVPKSIGGRKNKYKSDELLKDIFFASTFSENLGWKHTKVEFLNKDEKSVALIANTVFATLTKNPYSWLLSLYRNPYHQYYDIKPNFKDFISMPWKTVGRDNTEEVLENPIELWNQKNRSYLEMKDQNVMHLTTEGIFKDPAEIIDDLAQRFGLTRKVESFCNYEKSTKNTQKTFKNYQDYYLKEEWRTELKEEDIVYINQYLDRDLCTFFGYSLC